MEKIGPIFKPPHFLRIGGGGQLVLRPDFNLPFKGSLSCTRNCV